MPEVTRVGLDSHVGHASPTPNPFHQFAYATGSPDVFTNSAKTVRIGDKTSCTDPATGGSTTVFVNGKEIARIGDKYNSESGQDHEIKSGATTVFAG